MFPLYGVEKDMPNYHHRKSVLSENAPPPMDRRELKLIENMPKIYHEKSADSRTPMKSLNAQQRCNSTDSLLKSSGRKPRHSRENKTSTSITPRRCASNSGDRFIPNRSSSQYALGQFVVSQNGNVEEDEVFLTPSKLNFQKTMNEKLNGDLMNCNIIKYSQKLPDVNCYKTNMKVLYSSSKVPTSTKKSMRYIPQTPERILDAPDILDDYYLNLIDWSVQNVLAVCLGKSVYLWNATTGEIKVLLELENPEYVSSVAWISDGFYLAVGTSSGEIQLWDANGKKKRTLYGHEARVGSLSWNDNFLSSGSKTGKIHHHDVRVEHHIVGRISAHDQEVCGLKWSPDGKYLASGGNDNILNVFPNHNGMNYTLGNPLFSFNDHTAAVKALAWCPWQPSLLASGGGTADQHIRFWNCNMGTNVNSVNTKSQVCSILWSKEYHELISGHGFEHNQLIIWSYPKLEKITELTGHTSRVLHLVMSPDGSMVISGAADETLRLWKCFAVDPKKKKEKVSKSTSSSALQYLR